MIIASAQTSPKRQDIDSNLADHFNLIALAYENQVDLIVFPEMSLTGYEREEARNLAFTPDDSRLGTLRQLSADKNMIVVAGAPVLINNDLYIGEFILKPDNSALIYTKQFLHPGEEEFFKSSFDYNPIIRMENEKISFSVCADIDNPLHAENANKNGTTLYITSIFFSPNGIPNAHKMLSGYAMRHGMNILMSNFCGQSWGSAAGGQSGFWNKDGKLIASLNDTDPGLLILENVNNSWTGKSIKYTKKV